MPRTRLELQAFLENFMGNAKAQLGDDYQNVYFDPPESRMMNYPCIVYSLSDIRTRHANNKSYGKYNQYQMIYITEDPDDAKIQEIEDFQLCSFDRHYTSDNLHHFAYTIFF